MRHRFVSLVSLGFLLLVLSCGSDERSVEAPSIPGPAFTEIHTALVPNADLSPQEWSVQPLMTYKYQAIDETYPLDGQNIYAQYNYRSRFGYTNLTGYTSVLVTAIELNLRVAYSLHQDDAVFLTVTLYADGVEQGWHQFRWCTANPPIGCDFIGEPDGEVSWSHDFTGLSLNLTQLNSLEVEVDAYFLYDHGPELSHSTHIDNMYADVTFQNTGGGSGKDPEPHQQ